MAIGLVGYGRFGRLAAGFLARHATVVVHDRRAPVSRRGRIRPGSLREAASQRVVILAVPVSALRPALHSLAPVVRPGALVLDVSTVKSRPVEWMKAILPPSVGILGTHPLFGPDSVGRTLRGHSIVLTPVRISAIRLRRITSLLRQRGLRVVIMTPERHDRMVAETILLTHYLGRLVHYARLRRWKPATASYGKLLSVIDVATNDSLQLLQDVWAYNPYSRSLEKALRLSRRRLAELLRRPAASSRSSGRTRVAARTHG